MNDVTSTVYITNDGMGFILNIHGDLWIVLDACMVATIHPVAGLVFSSWALDEDETETRERAEKVYSEYQASVVVHSGNGESADYEYAYRGGLGANWTDDGELYYLSNHVLTRSTDGKNVLLYIKNGYPHRVISVFPDVYDDLKYEAEVYDGTWSMFGEIVTIFEADPEGFALWEAAQEERRNDLEADTFVGQSAAYV